MSSIYSAVRCETQSERLLYGTPNKTGKANTIVVRVLAAQGFLLCVVLKASALHILFHSVLGYTRKFITDGKYICCVFFNIRDKLNVSSWNGMSNE
jgi:hypothetical protein